MDWRRIFGRDEVAPPKGRTDEVLPAVIHRELGTSLLPPFPEGCREVLLGMGCFWGAERRLWKLPGVHVTAVGYAGGVTPNPTYEEVCTGATGHAEVVRVIFDPEQLSLESVLKIFWTSHDPTQGMRQGNDIGTQYRSVIFVDRNDWFEEAVLSKERYQQAITDSGKARIITTDVGVGVRFYFAEEYHQQYLAKNPDGYCGLRGLGVDYCG
jgi:peptide-methionine (S)-S-oxide reductase